MVLVLSEQSSSSHKSLFLALNFESLVRKPARGSRQAHQHFTGVLQRAASLAGSEGFPREAKEPVLPSVRVVPRMTEHVTAGAGSDHALLPRHLSVLNLLLLHLEGNAQDAAAEMLLDLIQIISNQTILQQGEDIG